MRLVLVAGGLLGGVCVFLPCRADSPPEARLLPAARPVPLIVVLRRPGLRAYERVAEEFRGRVPAEVRVLAVRPRLHSQRGRSREDLRQWLLKTRPNLLFAIGQTAYDFARDAVPQLSVLHAMVYHHQDPRHHGIESMPPPQVVLLAFSKARPGIRAVGILLGPSTGAQLAAARVAARPLGISLVPLRAHGPADAIRQLHRAQRAVQGVWLLPDLDVLTAQVFQFAVALQYRRRIPLLGATATHVVQGALFAVDTAPATIGLRAAEVAMEWLGRRARVPRSGGFRGKTPTAGDRSLYASTAVRLSLNRVTAQRIGVDPMAFESLAPEVLP